MSRPYSRAYCQQKANKHRDRCLGLEANEKARNGLVDHTDEIEESKKLAAYWQAKADNFEAVEIVEIKEVA